VSADAFGQAMETAVNRWTSAQAAGSSTWATRQEAAARSFAHKTAANVTAIITLSKRLYQLLLRAHVKTITQSAAQAGQVRRRTVKSGLPQILVRELTEFGLNGDAGSLRSGLASQSDKSLEFSFPGILVNPAVLVTERESATLLQQFARTGK
jgi:hypothetical protein